MSNLMDDLLGDGGLEGAREKLAALREYARLLGKPDFTAVVEELADAIETRDDGKLAVTIQKLSELGAAAQTKLQTYGAQPPMPSPVAQVLQVLAMNYRPHEILGALAAAYEGTAQHFTEAHGENETLTDRGKAFLSCAEGLRRLMESSDPDAFDEVIYPSR